MPLIYIVGWLVVILLLVWLFKRVLRQSPTVLKVWIGGVLSAFVAGFIEGCPIGSPVGAGTAFADGQVHADLDGRHLLIEFAHLIAVPFFTGLADIRTYVKANPPPNIFQPAQAANPTS